MTDKVEDELTWPSHAVLEDVFVWTVYCGCQEPESSSSAPATWSQHVKKSISSCDFDTDRIFYLKKVIFYLQHEDHLTFKIWLLVFPAP